MGALGEELLGALRRRGFGEPVSTEVASSPVQLLDAARAAGMENGKITQALAEMLDVPFAEELNGRRASAEFVSRIPIGFARQHRIIGVAGDHGRVLVAITDLSSWPQLAVVSKVLGRPVDAVFVPPEQVLPAINAAYQQQSGRAQAVIEELDRSEVLGAVEQLRQSEDLLDVGSRAPVIKLVNLILFEAVKLRASDVHVQPYEGKLAVRFRIDGVLYDVFAPPKALQEEIVSRVKVMGRMNIAEKRLAQDGRATVEVGDRVIDLRIATLPTSFGERAVIRLLDKSIRLYRLGELGMNDQTLAVFRRLIGRDHGIILVTGPTGSGKTTTLYAALQEINAKEFNVLTLENTIEYRLDGISQTQVNERKGMTFATGLRHVLRQDPDIIMVGEIRDAETARMAIQSALTGHLVFSTLHTNDASGAVARLLDLGAEPYLVSSSLIGVMAQRLVRRVCAHCAGPHTPDDGECQELGLKEGDLGRAELRKGAGCEQCLNTGYRDRVGIFELLVVNETIQDQVLRSATASAIRAKVLEAGMQTLRQDGLAKVLAGVTTLEEVARVTARDE